MHTIQLRTVRSSNEIGNLQEDTRLIVRKTKPKTSQAFSIAFSLSIAYALFEGECLPLRLGLERAVDGLSHLLSATLVVLAQHSLVLMRKANIGCE